jgi:hypothetical protein
MVEPDVYGRPSQLFAAGANETCFLRLKEQVPLKFYKLNTISSILKNGLSIAATCNLCECSRQCQDQV